MVIFGLGIEDAEAAFSTFQDFRSSGWRKLGYLTQMDWGYVPALFARLRGENARKVGVILKTVICPYDPWQEIHAHDERVLPSSFFLRSSRSWSAIRRAARVIPALVCC
jgi:hypothetical protein